MVYVGNGAPGQRVAAAPAARKDEAMPGRVMLYQTTMPTPMTIFETTAPTSAGSTFIDGPLPKE